MPYCPRCFYDLRETPDHCPECGDTFADDGPKPIRKFPRPWWTVPGLWIMLAAGVGLALLMVVAVLGLLF